jgi:hypothetical protein
MKHVVIGTTENSQFSDAFQASWNLHSAWGSIGALSGSLFVVYKSRITHTTANRGSVGYMCLAFWDKEPRAIEQCAEVQTSEVFACSTYALYSKREWPWNRPEEWGRVERPQSW